MANYKTNIPQIGKVELITIRPIKKMDTQSISDVFVTIEDGLAGDHVSSKKRQVTLIQEEHLSTVGSILKKDIDPMLTRRNILVSGINLLSLQQAQFQIGEVILETTGLCVPCDRMEQNFGEGGFNALVGHGGITTKVIKGGNIKLNDEIKFLKKV